MLNNIKLVIKNIWKRLTWIHIVSIHPNTDLMKDKKWYFVYFYIRRTGKNIEIDDINIKEV